MAIRVALRHTTRYTYDRPVTLSPHVVRLRPAPHCRTPVQAYSFNVTPRGAFLNWQQDPFGNYQARLVFPEPSRELCVDVELIAHLTAINPFDFFLDGSAETYPFEYEASSKRDLAGYLQPCDTGSTHPPGLYTRANAGRARCWQLLIFEREFRSRGQGDL